MRARRWHFILCLQSFCSIGFSSFCSVHRWLQLYDSWYSFSACMRRVQRELGCGQLCTAVIVVLQCRGSGNTVVAMQRQNRVWLSHCENVDQLESFCCILLYPATLNAVEHTQAWLTINRLAWSVDAGAHASRKLLLHCRSRDSTKASKVL